jgi:A/G-specific adenine glycosylase
MTHNRKKTAELDWLVRLCCWYRTNRRDLPWRRDADPYRIWISEAMLQQTRVETAIPYYERWLARFPDVAALATATEQDVLKHWEGLGYYSRARNLHRTARELIADHDGRLPQTADGLRTLPGIGSYTAAAVASIAFGEPVPVLDGNVRRVMARILAIGTDPRSRPAEAAMLATLTPLLEQADPAEANQALMELGALVCLPRNPRCERCPVPPDCRARCELRTDELPVRKSRPPTPHHHVAVALIERRGRLLLIQRPTTGLLGGLWELPGGRITTPADAARDLPGLVKAKTGLDILVDAPLPLIDHAFSHFSVTLHPWRCEVRGGRLRTSQADRPCRWATRRETAALPLPRAVAKVLEEAGGMEMRNAECGMRSGEWGVNPVLDDPG